MNTILFDLDGTLLPMDQEVFVKGYFKMLFQKVAVRGYTPESLEKAIWAGIAAMVKNDNSKSNEEAFWSKAAEVHGEQMRGDKELFTDFYRNEFEDAKRFCGFNPKAASTVRALKQKGFRVALATSPIFPAVATEKRIRWTGLAPEDFALCTTYENIGYCKPNLEYYREVLRRLDARPEDCLMVGNDVSEDMVAEKLGMKVFLLDDCLINKEQQDIEQYPHGGFDALMEYIGANCPS